MTTKNLSPVERTWIQEIREKTDFGPSTIQFVVQKSKRQVRLEICNNPDGESRRHDELSGPSNKHSPEPDRILRPKPLLMTNYGVHISGQTVMNRINPAGF